MIRLAMVVLTGLALAAAGFCRSDPVHSKSVNTGSARRAVIDVMPNALVGPGPAHSLVVGSTHTGKEPQIAKVYQDLQRRQLTLVQITI